jgi:FMN-dependent oxidoreductase (nitrilotriacetate monooxygenase family)
MEVYYKLWDSVADDAILADKASGVFADPDKIAIVEHEGEYFRCNTPSPVWPSAQRRPVLFQAGSSSRGQRFAMKHAEVVFAIQPNLATMKRFMTDFRTLAAEAGYGRTPGVTFGIQPIIGGTEEEARAKLNGLIERIPPDAWIARLSGSMGIDFSGMELDRPLEQLQTQGSQGLMKAFSRAEGERLTLRDVAVRWGLAVGMPQLIGTPEQVADQIEAIWRETGCHGFNVTPHVMPSSVEEFVDEVVPILQRRGIYRTEYEGSTFRENLEVA